MADLVLDKDVLVLISSIASERIELARATFLKTCENTCRVNIRSVDCLNDLRGLEREQRDIVLYIHDTFESEKRPTKRCTWCSKGWTRCYETCNNEIYALFSFSREKCDDFTETVKTSSLKFAVYDLSTMQECKTKQNGFS